jgi:4-oxalomesaconate hydratase
MGVNLLVIVAHMGDFVWRSSGVIGEYIKKGRKVGVVSLTYGEKGESGGAWKKWSSLEEVKNARKKEAECSSKALGVSLDVLDWGDYPLIINKERLAMLTEIIRANEPEIVLIHSPDYPLRHDHNITSSSVLTAIRLATSEGFITDLPSIPEPKVFGFDPHIGEQAKFYPHLYINITDVYDLKLKAMNCLESQKGEIEYYSTRDSLRGLQTKRFGKRDYYKYAEAFYMYSPIIGEDFP